MKIFGKIRDKVSTDPVTLFGNPGGSQNIIVLQDLIFHLRLGTYLYWLILL